MLGGLAKRDPLNIWLKVRSARRQDLYSPDLSEYIMHLAMDMRYFNMLYSSQAC
jgi:hypothetical protein